MAIVAKPTLKAEDVQQVALPWRYGTLECLLDYIGWVDAVRPHTIIQVDGEIADDLVRIVDYHNAEIVIAVAPHGGDGDKNILASVAMIAISVAAPGVGGAIAKSLYLSGTSTAASLFAVGFSMVGALAVSAIFPPPDQSLGDSSGAEASQSFYLSGQSNQMIPYGVIPRVYGTHKVYPRAVGYPLILPRGEDNYQTMLFDFGYGPLDLEDIRIGDTPISAFDDVRVVPHYEYRAGEPLQLYNRTVDPVSLSFTLEPSTPETAQQGDKADTILLDFTVPQGLFSFDTTTGEKFAVLIQLRIKMREVGSGAWQDFGDVIKGWRPHGSVFFEPTGVANATSFDLQLPKYVPQARARALGASREYVATDPNFFSQRPGALPIGTSSVTKTVILDTKGQGAPKVGERFISTGTSFIYITGVAKITSTLVPPDIDAYQLTHERLPAPHPFQTRIDIFAADSGGGGTVPPDSEGLFHYGFPNKWNTFVSLDTLTVGQSVMIFGQLANIASKSGNTYTLDTDINPFTQAYDDDRGDFVNYEASSMPTTSGINTVNLYGQRETGFINSMELFVDPSKRYEFRVTKVAVSSNTGEVRDEIVWSGIRSLGSGLPVTPDGVHTLLEIEIKATDQLQGVLDKVSAVATSRLWYMDDSGEKFGATRNPAWIYADILTGDANGRKVSRDKLDKAKLLEWAKECDQGIPSGGNPQVYLIKSSVTPTKTTATISDTVGGQKWPTTSDAIYRDGRTYKITAVTRKDAGSGFSEYAITFETMQTAMKVDGDFNTITIAAAGQGVAARSTCDLVVDFKSTVREMLQIVAATGRATPIIRDGKYSVITESSAKYPVQMFTNRNAANIQATMLYLDMPEALRVKYIDELTWIEEEVIIPNGTVLTGNETKFEDLKLVGTTRRDQAIRYGRYYLAEAKLRRESVTLDCDFEHLVATRGDIISLATDVLKSGGTGRYITDVVGNVVTLDEALTDPSIDTIRHRDNVGKLSVLSATLVAGKSDQYTVASGHTIQKGDLVELGTKQTVKNNYLVQGVQPASNLSASLSLVEHRPEILNAESGNIPKRTPLPGLESGFQLGAARSLGVQVGLSPKNDFVVMLAWSPPSIGAAATYQVFENSGSGKRMIATTESTVHFATFGAAGRNDKDRVTYSVEPVGVRGERGPETKLSLLYQKGTESVTPPSNKVTFPVAYDETPAVLAYESNAATGAVANILLKKKDSFSLQFNKNGTAIATSGNWFALGRK